MVPKLIEKFRNQLVTLSHIATIILAAATAIWAILSLYALIITADQLNLQTKAINLQIESIQTQNEQLKKQTEAVQSQTQAVMLQTEAMQKQIQLNKPTITLNVYCPKIEANTVNHGEFHIYNIGRSSGAYKIIFQTTNMLVKIPEYVCPSFDSQCDTGLEHAIAANDKEKYGFDLRLTAGDTASAEFRITLQCTSIDCANEPQKNWACTYKKNPDTGAYEMA